MKLFTYTWVKYARLDQMKRDLEGKKAQVHTAHEFVKAITAGDLETNITATGGNGEADTLSESLLEMRDQMKKISTEEKQRHWTTEGLAKFGEILRQKNDSLKALADTIISHLVKYLNANQGALYLINDDNPADVFIELAACYAYGRKKHLEQRIEMGQGLIGQVALEKSTLYMTSIPSNYIKITSGLGEALPRNLLIVPLKLEEKILGLAEVASFEMLAPYRINFVERLGESVASTIMSAKVNEKTRELLRETQTQAEQMRAQEEEMRQNMEELTATQEEMQRILKEVQAQERYMNELMDSSSDSILVIDRSYKILSANKTLRQTYAGLGIEIAKGFDVSKLFDAKDWPKYKAYYDRTLAGESFQHTELFESHGFKLYFMSQHTPIRDQAGNVVASAVFAKDVTALVNAQKTAEELASGQQQQNEELKAQEEELRQNMEELSATQDEMQRIILEVQKKEKYLNDIINVSNDVIFTVDAEYNVISYNNAMEAGMRTLGIHLQKGFCLLDIFSGPEKIVQKDLYDRALTGEAFERTEHFTGNAMDVYSIVNYAPLKNESGDTYAVVVFSKDVTAMHRTLNEVKRKERELNEIINASSDSVWTIDVKCKLMAFNKNFVNVFAARNVNVFAGLDMIDVLQEEERGPQTEIYARVFGGESFELTQTFTWGGEETHILISYSPIRDQENVITGATVYAKNITGMVNARKQAERLANETLQHNEVLRKSQEELASLQQKMQAFEARERIHSQTLLLARMDGKGTIGDVNDKLVELSGYCRDKLVGRSCLSFCNMPKKMFAACRKDMKAGKTWRGIIRCVNRMGEHYWMDATITPQASGPEITVSGYPVHPMLGEVLFREQVGNPGREWPLIQGKAVRQKGTMRASGTYGKLSGNKAA